MTPYREIEVEIALTRDDGTLATYTGFPTRPDLRTTAKTYACDLRTAAFALAISRVMRATRLRGN